MRVALSPAFHTCRQYTFVTGRNLRLQLFLGWAGLVVIGPVEQVVFLVVAICRFVLFKKHFFGSYDLAIVLVFVLFAHLSL